MKLKHKYSGKSLNELLQEFGLGEKGFYSDWFKDKAFAKEKAPAGLYEIDFEKKLSNLTYDEQKKKLKKGYDFPRPAVLAEAILVHYKNTGKKLMNDWYSRTSLMDSDGGRVYVGYFDSDGLVVHYDWDDNRNDYIGVSVCKKIEGNQKVVKILPEILEINGIKYKKA